MSKLKNKSIKAISAENENQVLYNWSAQKCLIAEIEYEDNSYCLNNSKWYQIDHSFETQEKGLDSYIDNDFKSNNYTIVLGIISKGKEPRPNIPFFSKVAIRYATKTLSNLGYNVAIRNIHDEESN